MTKRARIRLGLACTLIAALGVIIWSLPPRPAVLDCAAEPAASLLVDTSLHTLALCEHGQPVEAFGVRLGKQGTGKTREGDEKTPLGRYALSAPSHSDRVGRFALVGYPTSEQRARGLTGSAIGVHGPHRKAMWLGRWVNSFDTTDGCIGVSTDAEMTRIADFITKHGAHVIVIR